LDKTLRFRASPSARAYRAAMQVVRIVDGDERSLTARVARVLAALGPECTVLRFTYWYTGRPPVHEAIVRR
jgi:hypothetical protein